MKASLPVAELSRVLATARKAVRTNPSLLAYSGVLIEVDESALRATGSDGELAVSSASEAHGASPGSVLLAPKPLGDVLARLPDTAQVTIEVVGPELKLSGPKLPTYRFRTIDTTFAKLPAPAAAPCGGLEQLPAATSAITAALAGSQNPMVQLVASPSGLVLHATDGFRLAKVEIAATGLPAFSGTLALHALDLAVSLRPTGMAMDAKGRTVRFESPSGTCVLRLAATPFPPVDTVLENAPSRSLQLPRAELLAALQRLSAIADASPLRVELQASLAVLSVQNPDRGEGREELEIPAHELTGLCFGANPQFLTAALAALNSPACSLAASSPTEPLFFSSPSPLPMTVVVMPVKLD